ncbi:MAG: hypothetical protein ACREFQ_17830, partial [Stellaceae bacterium]
MELADETARCPFDQAMERLSMRHAYLVVAGLASLATLAGCTYAERNQVSANPPTVSYRVAGNDISQANVSAQQYCQRYSQGAVYEGLQATPSGNVAVYSCSGPMAPAMSGTSVPPKNYYAQPGQVPPPPYGEPQIQCATPLHQNQPGGTDYVGPPATGCPTPSY